MKHHTVELSSVLIVHIIATYLYNINKYIYHRSLLLAVLPANPPIPLLWDWLYTYNQISVGIGREAVNGGAVWEGRLYQLTRISQECERNDILHQYHGLSEESEKVAAEAKRSVEDCRDLQRELIATNDVSVARMLGAG